MLSEIIQPLLNAKLFNSDALDSFWLKLKTHSGTPAFNYSNSFTYAGANSFLVFEKEYIQDAWKSWVRNSTAMYYNLLTDNSELRRRLFSSMKTRLVDEMLTKVDRMTMAHSLEARVPFLDHVFVEHCIQLSDKMKISNNGNNTNSKFLLRRISEDILPHEIVFREKHGFDMPIAKWMRSNNDKIYEMSINGSLISNGILNRNKYSKILSEHKAGTNDYGMLILNIFAFENWYNAYKSNIKDFSLTF